MGDSLSTGGEVLKEATGNEKQMGALSFKQIVANETLESMQQLEEEIDLVSEDEEEADDDVDKSCLVIRLMREEKVKL